MLGILVAKEAPASLCIMFFDGGDMPFEPKCCTVNLNL